MKKYFKYFVLLFLLIVLPEKSYALCDNSRLAELQKIAGNVRYGYEFNGNNFNITLTNLTQDIYVEVNNQTYNHGNSSELTLNNYDIGDTVQIKIIDKEYCSISSLNIIYINLPKENKYYDSSLCEDIQDYKYCKRWYQNNLTYEKMEELTDNYRYPEEKIEEKTEVIEETKNYAAELLITIYIKYYFVILPTIIIMCIIGMYKLNKKRSL